MSVTVNGRVSSAKGEPQAGVQVVLWARTPDHRLEQLDAASTTDAAGDFSVDIDLSAEVVSESLVIAEARRAGHRLPGPPGLAVFETGDRDLPVGRVELIVDDQPVRPVEPVLTLSELGGEVASVVGAMQAELNRYPIVGGAFVVDEIEVTLPVRTSVDLLGQLRTEIADGTDTSESSTVRLMVRPLKDAPSPAPPAATVPLEDLDVLTAQQIDHLHELRVFDLLSLDRLLTQPASRAALQSVGLPEQQLRGRAEVIHGLGLPGRLAVALLKAGVTSREAFLSRPPDELASAVGDAIGEPVTADVLSAWRERSRELRRLGAPPKRSIGVPLPDGERPDPVLPNP
jgi:hypothetical protein